jgi:DNA-binding response OmpR family regulator
MTAAPFPPRILVVEDSAIVALEIEDVLTRAGYVVVGPALSYREAVTLARTERVDFAVLDVNLGPQDQRGGVLIADLLCALGTPFVFLTAYDREALDPRVRAFAHIQKPMRAEDLLKQIDAHLRGTSGRLRV